MNKRLKILFLFFFLLLPIFAKAEIVLDNVKEKMLQDLDIIKSVFEVKYAPYEWKYAYANWQLEDQIDLAKGKVLEKSGITLKDYQRILLDFFNSTQDFHVGVHYYSTEFAILPFRIQSANGRYYVAWVWENVSVGVENPLKKGDEILFFDGKPVDEAVQEIKSADFGNHNSAAIQSCAEATLTMRTGSSGSVVPQGMVSITARLAGTDSVHTYCFQWSYYPEEILPHVSYHLAAREYSLFASGASASAPLGKHPFFFRNMTTPLYQRFKKGEFNRKMVIKLESEEEDDDHFLGSKESFVPALGPIVWKPRSTFPFKAYIYRDGNGKRVGYVRIPHYLGSEEKARMFGVLMKFFNENTHALVVDQVNNPGGSLFYLYALASMLTSKPLALPTHQEAITQENVFFALEEMAFLEGIESDEEAQELIGETLDGYPVNAAFVKDLVEYLKFIKNEWECGRQMTASTYLYGIKEIKPHPQIHYEKPVFLLVNELAFSCGDFLPAILQDNKQAKILGNCTAGAGGYVLAHVYPNLFGVQEYSFTASIAKRLDGAVIENNGVTPDAWITLTERDLEENYPDYLKNVQDAISRFLQVD